MHDARRRRGAYGPNLQSNILGRRIRARTKDGVDACPRVSVLSKCIQHALCGCALQNAAPARVFRQANAGRRGEVNPTCGFVASLKTEQTRSNKPTSNGTAKLRMASMWEGGGRLL